MRGMIENEQDVKPSGDDTSASPESTEGTTQEGESTHSQEASKDESSTEESPSIDYAAELKKLEESRDRAQETAHFEREKRKELEKDLKGKDEVDIDSKINERVNQALLASRQDLIDEELDSLTTDKAERDLIQAIYTKRLNPASFGFSRRGVKQALTAAKIIANLPRFEAELKAKAKAEAQKEVSEEKGQAEASGGSSTRREPKGEANKNLNADERALLARSKSAKERIQRRHF